MVVDNTAEKIGRPTLYDPKYNDMAETICRDHGCTLEQLAKIFKVHVDSIYEWKKVHPAFSEAIQRGMDDWNNEKVEKSLYKRASGYTFEEVTIKSTRIRMPRKQRKFGMRNTNPKRGEDMELPAVEVSRTVKHVAPDPASIFFVLQNRNPQRWKNVRYIEASVSDKHLHLHRHQLDLSQLETSEVEKLRRIVARCIKPAEPARIGPGASVPKPA